MAKRYLIDTNILIEYSSSILPDKAENFTSKIVDEDFNILIINKIHLLYFLCISSIKSNVGLKPEKSIASLSFTFSNILSLNLVLLPEKL